MAGEHDRVDAAPEATPLGSRLRLALRAMRKGAPTEDLPALLEALEFRQRRIAELSPVCVFCYRIGPDGEYSFQLRQEKAEESAVSFEETGFWSG